MNPFRDEEKASVSAKVIEEVDKWMERFDCLVIGPGLGRDQFLLVRIFQSVFSSFNASLGGSPISGMLSRSLLWFRCAFRPLTRVFQVATYAIRAYRDAAAAERRAAEDAEWRGANAPRLADLEAEAARHAE